MIPIQLEKNGTQLIIGRVSERRKPVILLTTPNMPKTLIGTISRESYADALAKVLADIVQEERSEWRQAHGWYSCGHCFAVYADKTRYCPSCGRRMCP